MLRHQRGRISIARQGGCESFIIMASLISQRAHGLCPLSDSDATLGPCISSGPYAPLPRSGSPLCEYSCPLTREALIKSLFAFILEFLCNARNGLTRIASYLRKPMTKQCIKILIKENSMN